MKNLIKFLTPLVLMLIFSNAQAQNIENGLLFEDENYAQVPLIPIDSVRGDDLNWWVDLTPHCPTPGDQGMTASCVGWAIASALTVERAIAQEKTGSKNIDPMMHSAFYIYQQIKTGEDCTSPSHLSVGLKLLKLKGDCLAADLPNSISNCDKKPDLDTHAKAANYMVKNYERLFTKNDDPDRKIDNIRSVLGNGQPVIIGATVPNGFRYSYEKNMEWPETKNGHAMLIVGYDDLKGEFKIMNSYGPNWGEKGFFSVSYDVLVSNLYYGYRIVI